MKLLLLFHIIMFRAAAYTKLDNHHAALKDCQTAISTDPNYSKAYGRMGLAYASLNDHQRARDCYKKAIELDPENESYKNNLRIAEEKLAEVRIVIFIIFFLIILFSESIW